MHCLQNTNLFPIVLAQITYFRWKLCIEYFTEPKFIFASLLHYKPILSKNFIQFKYLLYFQIPLIFDYFAYFFVLIFLLFFRDVCLDYTLMMHLKLLTICQHFHFLNYLFTDLSFEIHETTHFKTMYFPGMCLFPRNHS